MKIHYLKAGNIDSTPCITQMVAGSFEKLMEYEYGCELPLFATCHKDRILNLLNHLKIPDIFPQLILPFLVDNAEDRRIWKSALEAIYGYLERTNQTTWYWIRI